MWPQTGAAAATVAIAPLANWLLVFKLGFGLEGAAAATVLLYAVETIMLLVIVYVRDRRLRGTDQQTWHGWCVIVKAANQLNSHTSCAEHANLCVCWLQTHIQSPNAPVSAAPMCGA